jgi:anti-sigma factor RsiW
MRRPPIARRHLDTRTLLDYLDQRLDPQARHRVEDHLGGPCGSCRERLREIGQLVQTMRQDRSIAPPETVRSRALQVLVVRRPLPPAAAQPWRLATQLFDSLVDPLPAFTRRAIGNTRWLKFALADHTLEIEAEPEASDSWTLRGRLDLPEPGLHRIEVEAREEHLSTWPDAGGRFAIDRVPGGPWTITVRGPAERFRLPTLTP